MKSLNRLMALVLLFTVSFLGAVSVQAGPSVNDLTQTNLGQYSTSPFHLNTDRFNPAFQAIGSYLSAHDELPASTILIADNHGNFLRGIVTDYTYYTYGTHKCIELYAYNPEDGSQFLTIEIWLPKEQQWNTQKSGAYLSSFRPLVSFLANSTKYRMDLVFQDEAPLTWGKGYNFKLDDEGISLSFSANLAAHPKSKTRESYKSDMMAATPTPSAKMMGTPTISTTDTGTPSATPTATHHHKHKSKASVSATATAGATPMAATTPSSN